MKLIRDPYAVPGQYRKAQLHCHTTESDGKFRPAELLGMYREAGYSFVSITDHNRVTRYNALDSEEFLTILGTEDTVTRWFRPLGPHMGRLFVKESLASGLAQDRIDRTVAEAGIAGLCHLSWTGNLWTGSWTSEAVQKLQGYRLLEIWNPHSDPREDIRRWEMALAAHGPDQPVWGLSVDDCHSPRTFNKAWIMAKVDKVSADALRKALRQGAFYSSTGLELDCGVRDGAIFAYLRESAIIRIIDSTRKALVELSGRAASYAVRGDEGYVRIECEAGDRRAWSQPFWIIRDS